MSVLFCHTWQQDQQTAGLKTPIWNPDLVHQSKTEIEEHKACGGEGTGGGGRGSGGRGGEEGPVN